MAYLAGVGIEYARLDSVPGLSSDSSADDLLAVYDAKIGELKERGGYITADVIDVDSQTPGLDAMLKRFARASIGTDED